MRGFEPPLSGPPDQHFNRTKLHPVNKSAKIKKLNILENNRNKEEEENNSEEKE
tara:strand:+ start:4381 stop:4542 length:162 start_codon:yes stop_codon:yes gene_type:complete